MLAFNLPPIPALEVNSGTDSIIGVTIKTLYPFENGPRDKVVKELNTTFGSSFQAEKTTSVDQPS